MESAIEMPKECTGENRKVGWQIGVNMLKMKENRLTAGKEEAEGVFAQFRP